MSCREQHESCGHDHHDHDHGHGHGHDGHKHDENDIEGVDRGEESSLVAFIDTVNVRCLNEKEGDHGGDIFKPWHLRTNTEKSLSSDADEQLIIHIPFTASVTIKTFCIVGGDGGECPSKIKFYVNNDSLDFSSADSVTPSQEFDLVEDRKGAIEYPTKVAKFQNVTHLAVFIPANFGADVTKLFFLGFKGTSQKLTRQPIIASYEARAQLKDHKVPDEYTPKFGL